MENSDAFNLLPQSFLNQFEKDFGKTNLEKYKASFLMPKVRGLRVNTEKIALNDFEDICNFDIEKVSYFDDAYYLKTDEKLGNSVLHRTGMFYLQEPSSMTPVASVKNFDFQNKKVLDLCASPGGKSLQIAKLLNNTGILFSNEIDGKRSFELFTNIERFGLKNVVVLNETPKNLAKNFNGFFDYIFVDAPCSGEGMFRKDETAIKEWNENLKFYNKDRQLEILDYANSMLKQNGILVYSTCTFNTIENESVVDEFTKNFDYEVLEPNANVLPFVSDGIVLNDNKSLKNTKHFFPFENKGEGQFFAVLKKNGLIDNDYQKVKISKENLNSLEFKICKDFLSDVLNFNLDFNKNFCFEKIGNNINLFTFENYETSKLKVISKGVILGCIEKNRLIPHHEFFMAYGKYFKNKIDLKMDSENLKRYLKGEQLDIKRIGESEILKLEICSNSYGAILCHGASLGGVKINNNEVKNHYPKALRINNLI